MGQFILQDSSILIVDDNSKNLQVLGKMLQQENCMVEFALNGETALEWVKNKSFDLILLDIMMPGMNGLKVCEKIRTNKIYQDVPIIFLSAETDKSIILEGLELGAQDYVTKPFDANELLARVKTQIELKLSKERLKKVNHWLEEKVNERTLELKEANEKLAKANDELMNLDKLKTEFLSIISHEIRTPLNGIMGPISLLKDQLEDDKLSNLINILDYSVSRLEKLSLTALAITELKTDRKNISRNEIKLKKLIKDSTYETYKMLELKNLHLIINQVPDRLKIFGDYKLLKICFDSILDNAIKYSPENGNIFIRTSRKDTRIVCEISDQGKGFSEVAFQRLFKMFMPGEPHIDQNIGLDLTLVKLIMDAHSGKIEVTNQKEGGASVKLIFQSNAIKSS
jgi:two-component system sensor histidine kinase/response regulator